VRRPQARARRGGVESAGFTGAEAQKWAHSARGETTESAERPEKGLQLIRESMERVIGFYFFHAGKGNTLYTIRELLRIESIERA